MCVEDETESVSDHGVTMCVEDETESVKVRVRPCV